MCPLGGAVMFYLNTEKREARVYRSVTENFIIIFHTRLSLQGAAIDMSGAQCHSVGNLKNPSCPARVTVWKYEQNGYPSSNMKLFVWYQIFACEVTIGYFSLLASDFFLLFYF